MTPAQARDTAREKVAAVLGPRMTEDIWSGNYLPALPIAVLNFDLGAVLPAVFFMLRFGQRRGMGSFQTKYGDGAGPAHGRHRGATIDDVARVMSRSAFLRGFDGDAERAILGDLLLGFCLENRNRALGRTEQVQRVAPAHYMASWVDLPETVAWLRHVPEMLVALLANQDSDAVRPTAEGDRTWFPVGVRFSDNLLLKAFSAGIQQRTPKGDRSSDYFDEVTPVGIDQLLMIRLAQELGSAPDKLRTKDVAIPNRLPLAERASRCFSDDLRRFVRSYATTVPRYAFLSMMESCMAIGLTTVISTTADLLLGWAETGNICSPSEQAPPEFLVDCSMGTDRQLRLLAEQSLDDLMRRLGRLPVVLMALRLLDYTARSNPRLKAVYEAKTTYPFATPLIVRLGSLLQCTDRDDQVVHTLLAMRAEELAEELSGDYPDAASQLRDEAAQSNPVWRLAEALCSLQGVDNGMSRVAKLFDSSSMIDRPNGIAAKRVTTRRTYGVQVSLRREVRSLRLTDSALDYLVHTAVLPSGRGRAHRAVSFRNFLGDIRTRYGFCVDTAPQGSTISNSLLERNASVLERRLRDLGLLSGVNDAEAMKRLMPRFEWRADNGPSMD